MSLIQHLSKSSDLITQSEEIRSGFIALALEKNRQATPFVDQARSLRVYASQAKTPADLLKIDEIQSALLTAAGFSDKALRYTDKLSRTEAIEQLIEHWKTAQTALTRIRTAFNAYNLFPNLFFVGAVIVESMALEIWAHLKGGTLHNAANLTKSNKVAALSNWLISL